MSGMLGALVSRLRRLVVLYRMCPPGRLSSGV